MAEEDSKITVFLSDVGEAKGDHGAEPESTADLDAGLHTPEPGVCTDFETAIETRDAETFGQQAHSAQDVPLVDDQQAGGSNVKEKRRRSKLQDKQDLICAVCGAPATGHNFGAVTCESCKAFFRRSAKKEKEKIAPCAFENDCKLDPHTRKFCASCRLVKCFAVGMKKEWILDGEALSKRKPITKKTKDTPPGKEATPRASSGSRAQGNTSSEDMDRPPQPLSDEARAEIEFILTKHKNIDAADLPVPETDVNDRQFTVDPAEFAKLSLEPAHEPQLLNMVASFMTRFIPFLKQLPPFLQLHVDDRIRILTQCSDEILALRSGIQYDPKFGGFALTDANSGEQRSFQLNYIEKVFGREVYDAHVHFVTSFNTAAKWEKPTMVLLMITNLFSTDRIGLQDDAKVAEAQEHYVGLLQTYLESKYTVRESRVIFANLLGILTEVRTYAKLSRDVISQAMSTGDSVNSLEPLIRAVLLYDNE